MNRILRPLLLFLLLFGACLSLCACGFMKGLFSYDKEHTVTFKVGNETQSVSVAAGETVSPPKNPKMENRIFSGWYIDEKCTKEYDFSSSVDSDKTLYAGFVLDGAAITNSITLRVMPALVTVKNTYRTSLGEEITSQGSGFIYKMENGRAYAITNCHVAYSPSPLQAITVKDFQGETHEARLFRKTPVSKAAISAEYDLAILSFPYVGNALKVLPLASQEAGVGDEVISLGSPQNQSHAITYGRVLDVCTVNLQNGTLEESNVTFEVLYHSAAITNGSSGGPLLGADLTVVGVNYAGTKPEQGEGFGKGCAVPLSKLLEFLILYS